MFTLAMLLGAVVFAIILELICSRTERKKQQ